MAAGLNVIPLASTANAYAQQTAQALRNLQVGRQALASALAIMQRAVQASGGSAQDMGTLYGLSAAQAQVVHDEIGSFSAHLTDAALVAAWDQVNAVCGIAV
jgi:hypothetical protein